MMLFWDLFVFPPTSSERHVGKLLPGGGVLAEVAVRLELHPFVPGVVQAVVDGRGDADLVSDWDGESCRRLSEAGEGRLLVRWVDAPVTRNFDSDLSDLCPMFFRPRLLLPEANVPSSSWSWWADGGEGSPSGSAPTGRGPSTARRTTTINEQLLEIIWAQHLQVSRGISWVFQVIYYSVIYY